MATLIKEDGTQCKLQPKNGTHFTLEEMQEAVGGFIQLLYLNADNVMIINEYGKFDKNLKINELATIAALSNQAIQHCDYIVGNAIVCRREMIK